MNRLIILAVMASTFGLCSAKKTVTSKWEKAAYHEADSINFMDYKYNGKLLYLISNDAENLYVHAKVTDKKVQRMLITSGMTVWLGTHAKGKKEMGIRYPLPMEKNSNTKGQRREGKRTEESPEVARQRLLEASNKLELIDFPNEPGEHIISTLNREYVVAHIAVNDKGEMNYTLQIPYKNIGFNYTHGALISLNLETGKMSGNNSKPSVGMSGSMGGGMSGGPSGGMGGGPGGGGGRPGGMQGGGRSQGQSSGPNSGQESSSISIKIKHLELK